MGYGGPVPTPDPVTRAVDQMQSCLDQAGEDWSQGATHCAWLAGQAQATWTDAVDLALWQSLAEGLALACVYWLLLALALLSGLHALGLW